MKKLLFTAFAALAFMAVADDDPVENTSYSPLIGVTEISATLQNTIVPVKFTSLDSGNIKATDLVYPKGIPDNTQLYVFDGTTQKYKAFVMASSAWAPLATVDTSNPDITQADVNQVAVSGTAIWLVFPANSDLTNQKVYIYGQVVSSLTSTISPGTTETPVSNLLCNPTDSTISGGTLITKLSEVAAKGDTISPIGESFTGNYIYNGTQWKHYYNDEEGNMAVEKNKLPDIAAGAGFWYVSKGGSGTIQWN